MQPSVYEFFKNGGNTDVIGVANEKDALSVSHVVEFSGKKAYTLPDLRASYGDDLLPFSDEINSLLITLKKYYDDKSTKKVLVAPIRTLLTPLPPQNFFHTFEIEFGGELDLNNFKNTMINWGYSVVDVVESYAEISF